MVPRKYRSDFLKMGKDLASLGSFGFLMAGSILIGYYVGNFLDNYFGTSPWLLILFLLLGIVGGIIEYSKILQKVIKNQNKNAGKNSQIKHR